MGSGKPVRPVDAAAVFVDISGFNRYRSVNGRRCSRRGEMLADIMVAIFEPLIAAVVLRQRRLHHRFAGDAFMALSR